ncbi:Crp/Fnr family transcriptional regulator [Portibacter lacus]|uniref:cAMP-binding protein n=1 Tax=Portibacter lacus TaxID=1099794 RepID=A0AA37SJW8_9BACT|nr:Crp/Fnr family transcriptional regulator [Portibacter lacus]GLR15931.1 cAMP-binding protein [Portibacter lacus]
MTEKEINDFLVEQSGLPLETLQPLLVRGKLKTIKKKELLAEPGKLIETSYFLINGIVRHFVIDKKKAEFTKHFMRDPDFVVSSIPGFFLRTKDNIHCEAVTDLTVIEWTYEDLIDFALKNPKFFHFLLKCIVNAYSIKEKKELALHLLDAKERYTQFLEDFPGIAYAVPLRYIASYLNIRPETLSRIRAIK